MRPRQIGGVILATRCGHPWDRIENLGGGAAKCRDCGREYFDDQDSKDSFATRLLLRQATRFSFETKDASGLPDEIDAELVPTRYGGGWRVKHGGSVLCRKRQEPKTLVWGRQPYYDVDEVKLEDREQAVAMALDIAEARLSVVEA